MSVDRGHSLSERIGSAVDTALGGGAPKYHQKLAEQGKLFVRERLRLLLDDGAEFAEDGLLASALSAGLPADAVVTGVGNVNGRPVNDPGAFYREVASVDKARAPLELTVDGHESVLKLD